MSKLKTTLKNSTVENLGVFKAATMDGYWEDAANNDIQYVYLLGQLQATESLHKSQMGSNATRLRIKHLTKEIKELEAKLLI